MQINKPSEWLVLVVLWVWFNSFMFGVEVLTLDVVKHFSWLLIIELTFGAVPSSTPNDTLLKDDMLAVQFRAGELHTPRTTADSDFFVVDPQIHRSCDGFNFSIR